MKKYEPHPIALLFPEMTAEEYADLKKDMQEQRRKASPRWSIPSCCTRRRFSMGVTATRRGGSWGSRVIPRLDFAPEKHGTLAAWMRAKSLNMVHRHIPAGQKVAILLHAADTFPEVKAALNEIEEENLKRKKEGKALDAGDQRGNTAKQVGKLANAGPTTVKQVQKLKTEAPTKFKEVAKGKVSAKKAVQQVKRETQKAAAKATGAKVKKGIAPGDLVYKVGCLPPEGGGQPEDH